MRRLLDRLCRLPTPAQILRLLRRDRKRPQHWHGRLARVGRAILEPLLGEHEQAAPDRVPGGIDTAERFHRILHCVHGFRAGAVLGAALLVTFVLAATIYGAWNADSAGPSGLQALPGILAALAAVLGTIAALLMAVAVFALQLHGQRLGRAAFLIQYLTRREGLVPIAAFLLVVIGANATVALLAAVWFPHAALAMGAIDLLLLPVALLLALRLFCRLVTSVAGDFVQDCVVPGLVWEYERALREATTADAHVLRRLLGGFARALGIGPPPGDEVRSVLSRLGECLVDQAKYASPDEFRQGIHVVGAMSDPWFEYGNDKLRSTPLDPFCLSVDPYGMRLRFYGIGQDVIAGGARDKITMFLDLGMMAMQKAIDHRSAETFYDGRMVATTMYAAALGREDIGLPRLLGDLLDNVALPVVMSKFNYRRADDLELPIPGFELQPFDEARTQAEIPVLIRALGWGIDLIDKALRAKRAEDARHFQDRLFPFDQLNYVGYGKRFRDEGAPQSMQVTYDLHVYAQIVIASWCLQLAKARTVSVDTVAPVFARSRSLAGDPENVLRTWRRVAAEYSWIDAELGVAHWDPTRGPVRSGETTFEWASGDPWGFWVFEGVVALVLARSGHREPLARQLRLLLDDGCPASRIRAIAKACVDHDEIRTQLLGIPDDQQEKALADLVGLLVGGDRTSTIARLAWVVRGQPLADRCDALAARVAERLRGRRDLATAIGEMGALTETADPLDPPTVSYGSALSKAFLVGEGALPVDRADELADQLSRLRAARIAEGAASRAESVDRLADPVGLRDVLLRAVGTLANRGCRPSLVLLPDREGLIGALADLPEFEAAAPQQTDPDFVGRWGTCRVRRWPTGADASCIVVMDAGSFFGRCEPAPEAEVTLNFEEHNTDVYERWLADAERDETDVPDPKAVEIVVAAHVPVGLGVRNPHTAVRIDLTPTPLSTP